MTREEAVKWFIRMKESPFVPLPQGAKEAIDMAIDALSADTPITSGYITDDKEVPPYTTTSAVSADRPTDEDLVRRSDVFVACDILPQGWYEKMGKRVKTLPSVSADRPITSGYIADDKEIPPYTKTYACQEENDHSGEATEMVDLISRADVLEIISEAQDGSGSTYEVLQPIFVKISALPSADAVQGWIPCSERLPQKRVEVIYSLDSDIVSTGLMDDMNYNGEKEELHWKDLESGVIIEPQAWMPLPKPYKGSTDG